VAGNGTTFNVNTGGSATFIAGQNIFLYPGVLVQNGGNLSGSIATTGIYCNGAPPFMPASFPGTGESYNHELLASPGFKIYPNPNSGNFKVELPEYVAGSAVAIYINDMRGGEIFQTVVNTGETAAISLESRKPGIYMVRVVHQDGTWIGKVVLSGWR